MENEMIIVPPEGYEIDKENSTFECIKFRPIVKRWRDSVQLLNGVYVIVQNGNERSRLQMV